MALIATASTLLNSTPTPLLSVPLLLLTLYAYRHTFPFPITTPLSSDSDLYLPPWEYLWDDHKNFANNVHITSGLTPHNIWWAISDGVVLGVYEPVSLIIKMAFHEVLDFSQEDSGPRRYRMLGAVLHAINACLAFGVGRELLRSVNEYDYWGRRVEEGWVHEARTTVDKLGGIATAGALEKTAAGAVVPSSSPDTAAAAPIAADDASSSEGRGVRRRKGKNRQSQQDNNKGGGSSGQAAQSKSLPELQESLDRACLSAQSYLAIHESVSTTLCLLGTGIFAVHPLQAQSIGWISCQSYLLSAFFALLSVGCYVRHRTGLRRWRRACASQRRLERDGGYGDDLGGARPNTKEEDVAVPWRIIPAVGPGGGGGGGRKRGGRSNKKGSRGAARSTTTSPSSVQNDTVVDVDEAETFLLTRPKAMCLLFYVLATFCKSPSVTLPLVYIILDVLVYSCPLSVHPIGVDAWMMSATAAAAGAGAAAGGGGKDAIRNNRADNRTEDGGGPTTSAAASASAAAAAAIAAALPHRAVPKFTTDAFPNLVQLTLRALRAWTVFLISTVLMTIVLVRGNTKNLLDVLSPCEKVCKSVWALSWYVTKLFVPTNLVAAVERYNFSPLEVWEVAVSLLVVPYGTLVCLAYSTSSSPGRVLTCAWGTFVVLLLPSLGFIQHGRLFLAADRYMYIPLLLFGPLLGSMGGACVTLCCCCPVNDSFSSSYSSSSSGGGSSPPQDDSLIVLYAGGPIPPAVAASSGPIDAFGPEKLCAMMKGRGGGGGGKISGGKGRGKGRSGGKGKVGNRGREALPPPSSRVVAVGRGVKAAAMTVGVVSTLGVVVLLTMWSHSTTPHNYYYWRNSLLLWRRNLDLFPDTENAHVNLSGIYSNDERHLDSDKSLYHQRIAAKMRPDSPKYKANLGILYGKRNEMVEAKEVLSAALKDHPRSIFAPLMHKVYGQAMIVTGEWDDALRELEIAFALGEKNAMTDINLLMEKRKNPENEVKQKEKWKKIREKQLAAKGES